MFALAPVVPKSSLFCLALPYRSQGGHSCDLRDVFRCGYLSGALTSAGMRYAECGADWGWPWQSPAHPPQNEIKPKQEKENEPSGCLKRLS